jgi:hypothetical protein
MLIFIKAQVVGIQDKVAGEVPVAVVLFAKQEYTKPELSSHILNTLGKMYALDAIITMKELGIQHFPMTATGKIRKAELKDLVGRHLQPKPSPKEPVQDLTAQIRSIWTDVLLLSPEQFDDESDIFDFIDSITALKFCNLVSKLYNVKFRLVEIWTNRTIHNQVEFIRSFRAQDETRPAQTSARSSILDHRKIEDGTFPGVAIATLKQPGKSISCSRCSKTSDPNQETDSALSLLGLCQLAAANQ